MFESIMGRLTDKSAAGISEAARSGAIPNDAEYSRVVGDAETLVEEGRGDWLYIGSMGDSPQWEPPSGETRAEEPPPPDTGTPAPGSF